MFKNCEGGVLAPGGFKAGFAYCGLKRNPEAYDIGIIASDTDAVAAAVFTTNRVYAAPVYVSRRRLGEGKARAIVVNAGNANACTGKRGIEDAERMTEITAQCLGVNKESVFVASTGIIGSPLDMSKIEKGIVEACGAITCGQEAASGIAKAIMTTDTQPKSAATSIMVDGKEITIGGITKGAGMISPKMATMLSFITTDACIEKAALQKALASAVDVSFNKITVDGHMSTNDTVIALANGAAGNEQIATNSPEFPFFVDALIYITQELAKMMIKDAEGATKFIEIHVTGARSDEDAEVVARNIANSPLCKTAFYGEDANWGRITSAAGATRAEIDIERLEVYLGDVLVVKGGAANIISKKPLNEIMKRDEITVTVNVNLGAGTVRIWTCDLSYDYVKINAQYHT